MQTLEKINAKENMNVKITDFGKVTRLDINQLGATVPNDLLASGKDEEKKAWSGSQNDAIIEAMVEQTKKNGGDFNSLAEWTVTVGALYDWGMKNKRKAVFNEDYRSAITGLYNMNPDTGQGAWVQTTAYINKGENEDFKQYVWRPKSLYDTEFMCLAPAVITEFGGLKQIFLSGVSAWNDKIEVQHPKDVRAQIRYTLDKIIAVFEEAGGSRNDIVRLRPFMSTTDAAQILREEIKNYWKDQQPVVMMADELPMPSDSCVEIQVMGIINSTGYNAAHGELAQEDTFVSRTCEGKTWTLYQAGEFRAQEGVDAESEAKLIAGNIKSYMEDTGLAKDDICLIYGYSQSVSDTAVLKEALEDVVNKASLHIIPSRPIPELGTRRFKVEVTARKVG